GTEPADRHEGIARLHLAAVHHQPGNDEVARQRDVGQQARQRHRPAHGSPPTPDIAGGRVGSSAPGSSIASGNGASAAPRLASPLACAASQVSMSSGATTITRLASSNTARNTWPAATACASDPASRSLPPTPEAWRAVPVLPATW